MWYFVLIGVLSALLCPKLGPTSTPTIHHPPSNMRPPLTAHPPPSTHRPPTTLSALLCPKLGPASGVRGSGPPQDPTVKESVFVFGIIDLLQVRVP